MVWKTVAPIVAFIVQPPMMTFQRILACLHFQASRAFGSVAPTYSSFFCAAANGDLSAHPSLPAFPSFKSFRLFEPHLLCNPSWTPVAAILWHDRLNHLALNMGMIRSCFICTISPYTAVSISLIWCCTGAQLQQWVRFYYITSFWTIISSESFRRPTLSTNHT